MAIVDCSDLQDGTISLGGIELPDGTGRNGKIDWPNRYDWQPMASQVKRTIGGRIHYAQETLEEGRPITLEAAEGACWLEESHRDGILGLASAIGTVNLIYEGESFECVFDHSVGAASFTPKRINSTRYWYGTINLITLRKL